MDEAGQYWLGNPEFGNVQRETIHGGKETKWRMMICFHGIFACSYTPSFFLSLSLDFYFISFLFRQNNKTKMNLKGEHTFQVTHIHTQPNQINRIFWLSVKGSPSSAAVFFILSFLDYIMDYYASPNVRYHTDQELLYIIHMMTDYPPLAGEMEREKRWILFSSVD